MASTITTRTPFQAATKIIEKAYTNRTRMVPPYYMSYMNVESSDTRRSFATFLPIVELGALRYKPEGNAPTYDQPFESIPTSYLYSTYALAAQVTEEAQLEDPLNLMGKLPEMLADSETVTKDLFFNNVLNLGFYPSVVGPDMQPLFSTAHPLAPEATPTGIVSAVGQSFSNSLGATQLTPESLQQAYILFATLLSDRGLPSARTPRTLMVSPQMQKTAEEILGTPLRPYTDENTKNVVAGSVELMVNRYLTSNTAWYVLGGKGALGSDSHAMTVLHHWE
ncbi:MAG: Mu-like prophage major head subunit gpT family protein, partial [Candidatus Dormibacteria bacterium]